MSDEKKDSGLEAMEGDWATDFNKREGSNDNNQPENREKLPFLDHKEPGSYLVRLVGKYVTYLTYFEPFRGKRVITHPSYKGKDPAWNAKFYPQKKFAIHVIDRKDGKLKILDASKTLFECFKNYLDTNNCDPTGKTAPDFSIIVKKIGGKKSTSAMPAGEKNTLSKEDIDMILAKKVDLKRIYKPKPLETIQKMWDELPEDKKTPAARDDEDGDSKPQNKDQSKPTRTETKPSPEAVEESMPNSPAESGDEDLFGDDKGKDSSSW